MKYEEIPHVTLERLALYHRTLQQLEERGFDIISSQQLSGFLNIKPEKLRRDLSYCGSFGTRRVGYPVSELKRQLGKFLGLHYHRRIGIVGAGHLGMALAIDKTFLELGFSVAALFDKNEKLIGSEIGNVKIYDFAKLESTAKRKMIEIGVIAVPKDSAQEAADALVSAGILGIWNFAPVKLFTPKNVPVLDADLSFGLRILNYYITQAE